MSLDLNVLWYCLVGVLFIGYAILDGFDLGVGCLHLINRADEERRIQLNSIGPVWDGNEVWLVTGGGALFAAFPEVYATVFSAFYLPFMLLLFALIFRAIGIEFRSKLPMAWWRRMWDAGFFAGSLLVALLAGVAIGNLALGIPLDSRHEYAGSLAGLLRPYPLLTGITTVSLFIMHGAIYLVMKTEGELQQKVKGWVRPAVVFFVICYITTTMATLLYVPQMTEVFRREPAYFAVALTGMLAVANIPREMYHGREFRAFLSSCAAIATLLVLFGLGMFPHLVYSWPAPENSLTLYNAASSEKTLGTMAVIAAIGVPLVIAYTASIYWIFRGKVRLDSASY